MVAERTDNEVKTQKESRRMLGSHSLDFLFGMRALVCRKHGVLMMKTRRAVTLLELMVVLVILGILISIAVPAYQQAILQAQVKEAKSNLIAIYNAQKIYHLKRSPLVGYFASTDEDTINSVLHLDLEKGVWDYSAGSNPNIFVGQAVGTIGGLNCTYRIKAASGSDGVPFRWLSSGCPD